MTKETQILPCPCCDGTARLFKKSGTRGVSCSKWYREYIECQTCHLTTHHHKKPGAAIKAWNKRAPAIADGVGVEWQDIDTAPMYTWCLISDGKDIILARQDSYGDWDGGSYGAYAEVMETITLKKPTHWMPMPSMPKSTPPQAATDEG